MAPLDAREILRDIVREEMGHLRSFLLLLEEQEVEEEQKEEEEHLAVAST
jgi:rubrerythrin